MSMKLGQILALVGTLDDSHDHDTPRERFRTFLKDNAKDVGQLRDYVQECLTNKGAPYNRALQDLTNHIAEFLGFAVEFGRYAGVQGQLGFDGLWTSPGSDPYHIVAEIKTTDAYSIKTATITGYVDGLISERKIPSWESALGLYIVGRPDAELKQLENSIVAERRTHQLRVISIESLLSLAELKSKYDLSHQDILQILRPSGPKIDPIVNLIAELVAEEPQPPARQPSTLPAPMEFTTQPTPTIPSEDSPAHWLTSAKSTDDETAEECIRRLVGNEHYYAFSQRAAGRKHMKPGDRIAFYATANGVVAHATLSSAPERRPRPDGSTDEEYPWVFSLTDAQLYLENPVVIDAALRANLDQFRGRDPDRNWAYFVQATHKVSPHDFNILTRQ